MAMARPATTLRQVVAVAFMRALSIPTMFPSVFIRHSPSDVALQRIEECEELLLLGGTERAEASRDALSLAAVALDRVFQGQGLEIVHVPWSHAQAPQGRRPQFVGRVLWRILYNAVTGLDVMQQEVTERMNDLIPQCVGHGERATVDDRACRCRRDELDVAVLQPIPSNKV
jgi:hypothetical protein